jgi:hypothetical protein
MKIAKCKYQIGGRLWTKGFGGRSGAGRFWAVRDKMHPVSSVLLNSIF